MIKLARNIHTYIHTYAQDGKSPPRLPKRSGGQVKRGARGVLSSFGIWCLVFIWSLIIGHWNFASAGSFPDFDNAGGGSWQNGYYRPISVTNLTGSPITDYQIGKLDFVVDK